MLKGLQLLVRNDAPECPGVRLTDRGKSGRFSMKTYQWQEAGSDPGCLEIALFTDEEI